MAQLKARFVSDTGAISGLIRMFTDFWASHVEFVLDADWEPYLAASTLPVLPAGDYGTLGARLEGGIKVRPSNYATFTEIEEVVIPCTDAQKAAVIKDAVSSIGDSYDLVDICGIVFRQNWHERSHEICSVFLTQKLNNNGLTALRVTEHYTPSITPRDLYLSPLFQKAV
jgi:hypothetical protein